LHNIGKKFRIFGLPMNSWANHMPQGMHLKSEGHASNLYDPEGKFPLKAYCAEQAIPYADIGLPVAIDTFIGYGREFQRRFVPELEQVHITSLTQSGDGFELTTAAGETFRARRVVVAAGIVNFAYLPPQLAANSTMITHGSQHSDLSVFKGKRVAVIGAGASALDIAALLLDAGANAELIARRQKLLFHDPPNEPRTLWQRIKAPRSGLGTGWRSRMCTDIPLVFHAMPASLRVRAVERHLGPAPCWFIRDAVANRLPMHLGANIIDVHADDSRVRLAIRQSDGQEKQIEVDHVIAATGYRPDVSRLKFIDEGLRSRISTVVNAPMLNRSFESSVPNLFFIGAAGANSFGPLLRFAFGANFAATRAAARLAKD
jgi:thioredoxin reductase